MNAWMPAEPPFDPDSFSGVGRLFPLPEVVSFPSVVTPLHVFEERYRALTADALKNDGLITMAVLKPGWQGDFAGRPPLWEVGCLAKVISHHQDEEGRYNLLLLGLKRVRLIEEVAPPQAYRLGRLEIINDQEPKQEPPGLRKKLIDAIGRRLTAGAAADELYQALSSEARLGAVADLAAHSLPISGEVKLALLAEPHAGNRCRKILQTVEDLGDPTARPSSPPFSDN